MVAGVEGLDIAAGDVVCWVKLVKLLEMQLELIIVGVGIMKAGLPV